MQKNFQVINLGQTGDNDFAASTYVQTAVLKQGATGGEVKELQRRLKQWGFKSIFKPRLKAFLSK